MKGILILNVNSSLEGSEIVAKFINNNFGEVIVNSNKKISITAEVTSSHCVYSSLLIDNDYATHVDYLSKNVKLSACWNHSLSKVPSDYFQRMFIDSQKNFTKDNNFAKNLKEHYFNKLEGHSNIALSYLTLNTRAFVCLMQKSINNIFNPINIVLVHSKATSFIMWHDFNLSVEDIREDLITYGVCPNTTTIQSFTLATESLLLIQPLFIMYKFNTWANVDKEKNTEITMSKTLKYLKRLVI